MDETQNNVPATAPDPKTAAEARENIRLGQVAQTKRWRKDLDETLQELKTGGRGSRERSLAITKIQEAIMWLGMDLKDLGTPNPYPESYNPESPDIEPTADGLKL